MNVRMFSIPRLFACISCTFLLCLWVFCSHATRPVEYPYNAIDSALVTTVPLSTATSLSVRQTSVPRYGTLPQISVCANSDNSFDVAVYISSTQSPLIVRFDAAGNKSGEITPASISGARGLLGMVKIPDDGTFVLGWSRDNPYGDLAFEYWITRFDASGVEIFSTRLFGDSSAALTWSQGEPGAASTGRIVYNATTKRIGYYCGHTKRWDDNVRHQGGYIGFMNLDGTYYVTNDWFYSHNFDQRLAVVDSFYYALAHGDAYPRALGFSAWSDAGTRGRRLVDSQYFRIPGTIGDNTTNCQTGGIIPLSDGTFGIAFSSSIGREAYDVCFIKMSASGQTLSTSWLTGYSAPLYALTPRIAPYGERILIMWEEVSGSTAVIKTLVLSAEGAILAPTGTISSLRLSPWYDPIALPGGDVIWAIPNRTGDSLSICRIKGPPAL